MSYAETKYVAPSGDVEDGTRYKNAHGILPRIWDGMLLRLRPDAAPGPFGGWAALWADVAGGWLRLEPWEALVLRFTYDRALVRRKDCPALAGALRKFAAEYPMPGHVCHLEALASEIECRLADGSEWSALGLYGMSVSEPLWEAHDDETGENRPYNVNIDEGHWYVET